MNITNFSTFGSCSSRNIFNSRINKDYKKYFKINKSVEAQTLISLMSEPIEFDEEQINSDSKYDNLCVRDDLSKNFIKVIEKDFVDYIIIDTLFDVASDVALYDDKFLTLNSRIVKTDFFNSLEKYRTINIYDNFEEYYSYWTAACDNFFKLIEANCKRTKIILNCSRSAYKFHDSDGNLCKNIKFERLAHRYNRFRNLLDKYILENFDVDVLKFNAETCIDPNHIFGLRPTHFEEEYFLTKNQQLLEIIKNNNEFGFKNEKNVQYRENYRKEIIKTFEKESFPFEDKLILDKKRKSIESSIENRLRKYNTARIDIKNRSLETEPTSGNSIKIDNYSDFNLTYSYPNWFKNEYGKGMVINSQRNFLKFDIIVEGDGELKIYLKSPNYAIRKKKMPIYLRYTKFCIDNQDIFKRPKVVSNSKSYTHKRQVKDGERLTVYLEWKPV